MPRIRTRNARPSSGDGEQSHPTKAVEDANPAAGAVGELVIGLAKDMDTLG